MTRNGTRANDGILAEIVCAGATELLGWAGVSARPAEGPEPTMECAAVIGLYARELRGVVGIGTSAETLTALAACDGAGTALPAEDWLAEALNQLLGRIKNALVPYRVVAGLALPAVLRGVRLEVVTLGPSGLRAFTFDTEAGPVRVWIDARWQDGVVLERTDDPEMQAASEGDLVLF